MKRVSRDICIPHCRMRFRLPFLKTERYKYMGGDSIRDKRFLPKVLHSQLRMIKYIGIRIAIDCVAGHSELGASIRRKIEFSLVLSSSSPEL